MTGLDKVTGKIIADAEADARVILDRAEAECAAVKEKYAKYLPHSAGRYAAKRFRKAQCPIVERLTNSMMMHGRNNGKKLMTVRIVKHAFEIIHLLTGEVGLGARQGECPQATRSQQQPHHTHAVVLQGRGGTRAGHLAHARPPAPPRTPCRSW